MKIRIPMTFFIFGLLFLFPVIPFAEVSQASDPGKELYDNNCQVCHGKNGDGKGLAASSITPRPADFTDPDFWKGNVNRKITRAVTKGKGRMPRFYLKPNQIDSLTAYMKGAFKP